MKMIGTVRIIDSVTGRLEFFQFGPSVTATKHFAKTLELPVKMTNGTRVYRKHYYKLWDRYAITGDGKPYLKEIIDENEYLVRVLRDEIYNG